MTEKADVAVVVEQSTVFFRGRMKQVAPEEKRFVGPSEQTQDRWGNIEGAAQVRDAAGACDGGRADDEQRDFIGVDGNALAAINARTVIGDDDENRVGVERLFFCVLKELA